LFAGSEVFAGHASVLFSVLFAEASYQRRTTVERVAALSKLDARYNGAPPIAPLKPEDKRWAQRVARQKPRIT
jgi:hypothetical protein